MIPPNLPEPKLSGEEVASFLTEAFPQVASGAKAYEIEAVRHGGATVRLTPGHRHLRPGGTVSGPSIFGLCDYAAYVAILAHIGPVGLAVTTNASVDFLVRPTGPLDCDCRILKFGRRLIVTDAIVSNAEGVAVARAGLTYSVPPDASSQS